MDAQSLAKSLTDINALMEERNKLKIELETERRNHDRCADRLQLIQNELEKAQSAHDVFMGAAAKWAERVNAIGLLADEAKKLVSEAMKSGVLTPNDVTKPEPPLEPKKPPVVPAQPTSIAAQVLGDLR